MSLYLKTPPILTYLYMCLYTRSVSIFYRYTSGFKWIEESPLAATLGLGLLGFGLGVSDPSSWDLGFSVSGLGFGV